MLEAPFRIVRKALPGMYEKGWGRVINISSVHGLRASPYKSAYVSAKHGLEGFSKMVALEGGPKGVTSNCVCPAYVRTPLVEDQIDDQARTHGIPEEEVVEKIMLTEPAIKRLVEPEEVAEVAAFLCAPEASFINGASITMDGGCDGPMSPDRRGATRMTETTEGTPLWEPSAELKENAVISRYMRWLAEEKDLSFDGYQELWEWSVTDVDGFWASLWEFFDVHLRAALREGPREARDAGGRVVPRGGAQLRRARLPPRRRPSRRAGAGTQVGDAAAWSRRAGASCEDNVAAVAAGLKGMGVGRGDRVVAYLPNVPEAVVAFLACASIGAVWSSCSPDFGAGSVVDRFAQIEPKVLFAVDGYRYGGKDYDRTDVVAELQEEIPGLAEHRRPPVPGRERGHRRPRRTPSCGTTCSRTTTGRSSPSSGCPSTTPCGCSTPRGLRGSPRPSCTATAASCSSTSRRPTCT